MAQKCNHAQTQEGYNTTTDFFSSPSCNFTKCYAVFNGCSKGMYKLKFDRLQIILQKKIEISNTDLQTSLSIKSEQFKLYRIIVPCKYQKILKPDVFLRKLKFRHRQEQQLVQLRSSGQFLNQGLILKMPRVIHYSRLKGQYVL